MPTILISAGEASGELYGAQLMESLRRLESRPMNFFGLGGERMRSAGCETVIDSRDVAVVGLAEVVKHLPSIYKRFRDLLREVDKRKPDVAVLIDFPDFNFRLARELYRRGIPVVYFVSPQLWAWRQGRIKLVQKYVKKMLVIFPFEEKFYRDRGVTVEYVGHPLADVADAVPSRDEYARANGLDPAKQWIALLPGSRRQEIKRNLQTMLKAAMQLGPDFEFILPVASTLTKGWIHAQITEPHICLVQDAPAALAHARASIVASGTATVEAALAGNPFVVVYRVSPLTYTFGRHLVSVPHYAMANLIAEKRVAPELIQGDFTAKNIVKHLRELIPDGSSRSAMMADLAEVKRRLHPFSQTESASDRAARAVQGLLA
jgi:lipid-A-disaccharide synthase